MLQPVFVFVEQYGDDIKAYLEMQVFFGDIMIGGFDQHALLLFGDEHLRFAKVYGAAGFYFCYDQYVVFAGDDVNFLVVRLPVGCQDLIILLHQVLDGNCFAFFAYFVDVGHALLRIAFDSCLTGLLKIAFSALRSFAKMLIYFSKLRF